MSTGLGTRSGAASGPPAQALPRAANLLALDLGSSNGRLYAGELGADGLLRIECLARFDNGPVAVGPHGYWDWLQLWRHVGEALTLASGRLTGPTTLGLTSFGCDYLLSDAAGLVVAGLRHMRDPRTAGLFEAVYARLPKAALYRRTGAMEIEINTLVQLLADRRDQPWLVEVAQSLALLPDHLGWLLTGRRYAELTIASTTQLVSPLERQWDARVIEAFDILPRWLAPLVEPGTRVGPVSAREAARLKLSQPIDLVAVASHDTASAWAAVPCGPDEPLERALFISLGTWSLVGQQRAAPDLSDASRDANFSNECGVAGSTVHHKIQAGLWLLQETLRIARLGEPALGYAELDALAAAAPPLAHVFDPDDPLFRDPLSMPEAIAGWFGARGLAAPATLGALVRAIHDSLALSYRATLDQIEGFRGHVIDTVHIVGGGAQSALLGQAVADATRRRVLSGPVEAAVAGNLVAQLVARGAVADFAAGREIVRRSFEITPFHPSTDAATGARWEAAYHQFLVRLNRPS